MFSGALYSSSTHSLGHWLKPPSSPSKKAAPKGREDVPLSVPAGIHFFPIQNAMPAAKGQWLGPAGTGVQNILKQYFVGQFRFESSYLGESLNCPSVGYKQAAMTAASLTSPLSGLWAVPVYLVMPAGTKHLSTQHGQVSGGFEYGQKCI